MRSHSSFAAIIVSCILLGPAAVRADIPPEVEDPQCLGVNKEPAHATLMPYANLAEALAARRHASSLCRSLNGPWKFHWVPHPDQRPLDFYKPEFDASGWAEIPVPSCWQLLGYGTPYYRNFGYTFQKDWPRVLSDPPKDWTAYKERESGGQLPPRVRPARRLAGPAHLPHLRRRRLGLLPLDQRAKGRLQRQQPQRRPSSTSPSTSSRARTWWPSRSTATRAAATSKTRTCGG